MVEISAFFTSFSTGSGFCFIFYNMGMRQEGVLEHDSSCMHTHVASIQHLRETGAIGSLSFCLLLNR